MAKKRGSSVILLIIVIIAGILVLSFCCGQGSSTPDRPDQPVQQEEEEEKEEEEKPKPIGSITREKDVVEHGRSYASLTKLTGENDLYNSDYVHIAESGQALLAYNSGLGIRLYHNTGLKHEPAGPGEPGDTTMYVEEGVLEGWLEGSDGEKTPALFVTLGGTKVIVTGTEFAIIVRPELDFTAVSNFNGSVAVESGGERLELMPGFTVIVEPGQPPGVPFQHPATEIEALEDYVISVSQLEMMEMELEIVPTQPPVQ